MSNIDIQECQEFCSQSNQSNGKMKEKMQALGDSITIGVSSDKNSLQGKFDEFLIEAIDKALSSLGEPVKNSLYFRLQNDFNIEKNDIPQKIEEFSNIIHRIFGLGASRLEIMFLKNLQSKIKFDTEWRECEWSNWIVISRALSFTEYLSSLRKSVETSNRIEK